MALELDTTGDQIDHGDVVAFDAPTVLTFMFWAERTAETTADTPFIQKAPTGAMWIYRSSSSTKNFTVGKQGVSEKVSAADSFPTDTYTHLGFIFDSAASPKLTLKINGVTSGAGDPVADLGDGGVNPLVVKWVNGVMRFAHLKAWNVALTDAEYLAEVSSYPVQHTANNILWCPYDDATTAADFSGSGYNGTATGAVQVAGPLEVGYPKALADTAALGLSEAVTIRIIEAVGPLADTASLALTESLTIRNTESIGPLADSAAIGLAESVTVLFNPLFLSLTDSAGLGLSEGITVLARLSLADAIPLRLTESINVEANPASLRLTWNELIRGDGEATLHLDWFEVVSPASEPAALRLTWDERQGFGGSLRLTWREVPDLPTPSRTAPQKPTATVTVS